MHIINRAVVILLLTLFTAGFGGSESKEKPLKRGEQMNNSGPRDLVQLKEILDRESREVSLDVSLSLYDFASGEEIEINGSKPLYPASMIKTLLLLATLEQVETGKLCLQDVYILKDEDKIAGETPVSGSGMLQFAEAGIPYTIEELLMLMISISDNVATNILYEKVGLQDIEAMALRLKLEQTAFTRKMYDLSSPYPSNVSTAKDLTKILIALEKREVLGTELSKLGVKMMLETVDKERIGRYINEELPVANKVGTVSGVIGDMALIYFPHRPPIALTAAVKNPYDQEEAARFIGRLAELVVEHFAGGRWPMVSG